VKKVFLIVSLIILGCTKKHPKRSLLPMIEVQVAYWLWAVIIKPKHP
jgi:hypothetical protein